MGGWEAVLSWRRHVNAKAADADRIGWLFNAIAFSLMLVSRHWLRQGQPGLALAAGTQPLVAALLASLCAHRSWGRGFYTRWREALALAAMLHLQWSVRLLAINSSDNIMMVFEGGGSPLFLLAMLAVNNALVWVLLITFYGRPVLPTSAILLSTCALGSLLTTQPMCARALEAPGVVAPLLELYSWLNMAHFAAIPPGTPDLLTSQSHSPEQQCMVISNWLNLAGGVLFPLAAIWRLERRARRLHRQRVRQRHGQQAPGDQFISGTQVGWRECPPVTGSGCRWLESPALLFCLSSMMWIGAHAL